MIDCRREGRSGALPEPGPSWGSATPQGEGRASRRRLGSTHRSIVTSRSWRSATLLLRHRLGRCREWLPVAPVWTLGEARPAIDTGQDKETELSATVAAAGPGVSRHAIRRAIVRGDPRATKHASVGRIARSALAGFRARDRTRTIPAVRAAGSPPCLFPLPAAPRHCRLRFRAPASCAEPHLYARGGYGFGMDRQGLPSVGGIDRFWEWLRTEEFRR